MESGTCKCKKEKHQAYEHFKKHKLVCYEYDDIMNVNFDELLLEESDEDEIVDIVSEENEADEEDE